MQRIPKPADINRAFEAALNAGDLEALLALYEPDAVLIDKDGQEHRGLDAIRAQLSGLLERAPSIEVKNRYAHASADDVALVSSEWTLTFTAPDGRPQTVRGRSIEVVRRQADGNWLHIVDHPNGA